MEITVHISFSRLVLLKCDANLLIREEEDPDDYAFPLTLKSPRKPTPAGSPLPGAINGVS